MSEVHRYVPDAWGLARDRLELEAELGSCTSAEELAGIRAELDRVNAAVRAHEQQQDELAGLPGFWQDIYGAASDGPGFISLFSAIRSHPHARLTAPRNAYFAWPAESGQAQRWVTREDEAGRECYQCAHLVTRWRRRKADAAPVAALYVDLDHDQLSVAGVPSPSLIVESSPGRLQCYWSLTEPAEPLTAERHNRRLANALRADHTGWDLTQLLRVPGTSNRKYPDQPLVRVVARTGTRYDLSAFGPDPLILLPRRDGCQQPSFNHTGAAETGSVISPVRLSGAGREVWEGVVYTRKADGTMDRSASLVRLARVLFDAGATHATIVAALAERDAALGWRKYSDRADGAKQYQRIVDLVTEGS